MLLLNVLLISLSVLLISQLNYKLSEYIKKIKH